MNAMQSEKVSQLSADLHGDVLISSDSGYDEARAIWNAMIDKRPDVIARCADTSDAVRVVRFAREEGIPLAVRGAGHNIAGKGTRDGGILLDLSGMTAVQVDPEARRATVQGGATLGDLDAATLAHGLATPVGINSTTGIGGLTLGGGFGWISRKHGLTADNLVSAEVVTAGGDVIRASATEHADLFWALRGGSGNFGVVTNFEFRLHPVGPDLLSGLYVFPHAEGKSILQQYRSFAAGAPEELSVWVVMRKAPPLPFLPEEVHGTDVVVLALAYAGDAETGADLVRPLADFGTVLGHHVGVQPFAAWQQAFDPLLTPGARNYWKSHNFESLEDGFFDVALDYASSMPSAQCEVFIAALGGAASREDGGPTAYPHRDAQFVMNIHGRWDEAADDDAGVRWARDAFEACTPYATGGVYVNFITADEDDRVQAAYGSSYDRLADVKRQYDPTNLFSSNFNIAPV